MIKAVLQYYSTDERIFSYYLAQSSANIIKTEGTFCPKATITIESMSKLKELVSILNNKSSLGVTVIKAKKVFSFSEFIFGV